MFSAHLSGLSIRVLEDDLMLRKRLEAHLEGLGRAETGDYSQPTHRCFDPVSITAFAQTSENNAFLFSGQPDQQFYLQNTSDLPIWSDGPRLDFLDSSGTLLYLAPHAANGIIRQFYRTRALQ